MRKSSEDGKISRVWSETLNTTWNNSYKLDLKLQQQQKITSVLFFVYIKIKIEKTTNHLLQANL